jgi:hypothetical protein
MLGELCQPSAVLRLGEKVLPEAACRGLAAASAREAVV